MRTPEREPTGPAVACDVDGDAQCTVAFLLRLARLSDEEGTSRDEGWRGSDRPPAEVDWPLLLRLAVWHGVEPVVLRNITRFGRGVVPTRILLALRATVDRGVRASRVLAAELCAVTRLLRDHGIPSIAFKGPTLAMVAYGDIGLRGCVDLDLLVHRADIVRAGAVLVAGGYAPPALHAVGEGDGTTGYHMYTRAVPDAPGGRVTVDVQWGTTDEQFFHSFDTEVFWRETRTITLDGVPLGVLRPAAMLLALAIHGAKHQWFKLKWIGDVTALTRGWSARQWHEVLDEARRCGSWRMVALGALLADRLLQASIPPSVLRVLMADAAVLRSSNDIVRAVYGGGWRTFTPTTRVRWFLRLQERWGDRARYCLDYLRPKLHALLTPNARDRNFLPLPVALTPLYRLVRPVRLVWEYGVRRRVLAQLLRERFRSIR
jgi:hypothetical protein